MSITRPLLREVNDVLMDVFGYCLVPTGDVLETSQNSKKGISRRWLQSSLRY